MRGFMTRAMVLLLAVATAPVVAAGNAATVVLGDSPQAHAFLAAYGPPSARLIADRQWPRSQPLDLANGQLHLLLPEPDTRVEGYQYWLFVETATGQVYLARQGGFSGRMQFYGPIKLRALAQR